MAAGDALLKKLASALSKAPRKARREVGGELAEELEALTQLGFEDGKAPDGTPWKPVKRRGGKPLRLTDDLMGSIKGRFDGRRVRLGTTVQYGVYHQSEDERKKDAEGNVILPRRPFLPDEGVVPEPWEPILEETADEALARAMARLGAGKAK